MRSFESYTTRIPASAPLSTPQDRARGPLAPSILARLADTFTPACHCGDTARALAHVLPLIADALATASAQGYEADRLIGATEGAVHPAVADSVSRMFAGWDGAQAADARSGARFRAWHADARAPHSEAAPA